MAVILSGTGSIWKRFGHYAGRVSDIVALRGGTATARVLSGASMQTGGTTLNADAAESPSVSSTVDGVWGDINAWGKAQNTFLAALVKRCQAVIIQQVQLDAHLPSGDITSCLNELARQMAVSSDSLNASTVGVGAQATVIAVGNPVFVLSTKSDRGNILNNLFAETLRFAITSDSQTGSATARQEVYSVQGSPVVTDTFSNSWPGGSACSVTGQKLVDAALDDSGGNILTNGNYEVFSTANYPDNWVLGGAGVIGTDIGAAGSGYIGSNALKYVGDGSTLSSLRQVFNHAASAGAGLGGTPGTLSPLASYAVNGFAKAISSAPSAGVLRIRLVDGSNSVINDAAGNASSFTVDLTALTTSYTPFNGILRTPAVLPAIVKLEFALSTALTNTKTVHFDSLAMAPMTRLYNGGPAVAGFSGSATAFLNDAFTVATTNTYGLMLMWLDRFFNIRDKGIEFPAVSDGSETVADTLVV